MKYVGCGESAIALRNNNNHLSLFDLVGCKNTLPRTLTLKIITNNHYSQLNFLTMVNVKNLFGMAVMATALVSCSSSDDLATDGKGNENKAEAAYASFKINLPTTTGTRAADDGNPTFAEGDAKEYEVKNGTILIFDNSGNFVESAELGTMNPWTKDTDANGVTTAAAATVQLHKVKVGTSYKALVLLNNNSETTTPKVKLPISTTTTTDTYTSWSAKVGNATPAEYLKTDGIFMANAPKYESATKDPTTLVDIKGVYASREQAQANPATVVYVERGLAKVTMNDFAPNYPINAGTYKGDNVKIVNWQLDVTNKSTFPIHQADLKSGWSAVWSETRFYDTKESSAFKRVYWGTDPNYRGTDNQTLAECKNAFNMIGNGDVKGLAGIANPQYCLENTFDLDNMMQGQTTRVVFKAVYSPKTFAPNETFYKVANNTAVWHVNDLKTQIKTLALQAMGITTTAEQGKYDVKLDAPTNNISGEAGQHIIKTANITFSDETGTYSSKIDDEVIKTVNDKLGLKVEGGKITTGISTYLNGVAYYIARIKHFNTLTPWEAGQPTYKDVSRYTLEESNKKYLGRYGVLRNNWYALSVTKISNLGYPEVPEVKPETPDDENDQYINVEVKILDWAKRTQEIEL